MKKKSYLNYAFGGEPDDKDNPMISIKDSTGLKTGNYSQAHIQGIIKAAKRIGVDPYQALSLALQESGIGSSKTKTRRGMVQSDLAQILDFEPAQQKELDKTVKASGIDSQYLKLAITLRDKLKYGRQLGFKDEASQLQAYNGYGFITKETFGGSKKAYGIDIGSGIDMKKNPLYGKRLLQLKKDMAANKEIKAMVDEPEPVINKPKDLLTKVLTTLTPEEMLKKKPQMFADGGVTGSHPLLGLANQIPQIADALISMSENNPNAYSTQPILNPSTMKSMVNPYANFAMGGVSGIDEETMAQLQAMAEEQGISVEELLQQLGGQSQGEEGDDTFQDQLSQEDLGANDETDDEGNGFRYGGIKSKGKRKGNNYGGIVEGGEVIKTPAGKLAKIKGPKHESGGVDINMPTGTKVYSDRLKLDGKTMSERKLLREKRLDKLNKLISDNPGNKLVKNTYKRTNQVLQMEEREDMAIQKAVSFLHNPPQSQRKFDFGGVAGNPDETYEEFMARLLGITPTKVPIRRNLPLGRDDKPPALLINNNTDPSISNKGLLGGGKPMFNPTSGKGNNITKPGEADTDSSVLTTGDLIGLGGNIFNAIAPILNTRNAAANNKPNINRFKGFGRKALEDNTQAQDYVAGSLSRTKTDISTGANTSYSRNRNSARDVNTVRALDIATDMGKDKAIGNAENAFSNQMMSLLGQRAGLHNQQDKVVMTGEAQRDIEDKADKDNYYSNIAANLTNFGTNVQGIGSALNVSHGNKVDAKLISQLSRYGLSFDKDDNLIST